MKNSAQISREEEKILKILDLERISDQDPSVSESNAKSISVSQEESKQSRISRISQVFKHKFRSMRESYTDNSTLSGFYYYERDGWDYNLIEARVRMRLFDEWYSCF